MVNPETGEAVMPDPEAIESGTYAPFSRPLFIYVNVNSLKRPEMKRFVDFYLEHARQFAEEVDYVGLSEELYGQAREHFQQRLTGTHYLTADGEKRVGGLPEIYQQENLLDWE